MSFSASVMVNDHALAFLLTVMVMTGIQSIRITSSPINLLTLAGATADQFRRKPHSGGLRIEEALRARPLWPTGS